MAPAVHDPMPKHRYDSGPTMDPSEMVTSSDFPTEMSSDSTPDTVMGYGALVFPDSTIPLTIKSIILGRDENVLNFEREYAQSLTVDPAKKHPGSDMSKNGIKERTPDSDEEDEDEDGFSQIIQKHTAQGGAVRSYHYSSNKQGEKEQRIDLHPPADPDSGLSLIKQVSKDHMRIFYSPKEGVWKMHMLGRNGGWLNDDYMKCKSMVTLMNGDTLQICSLVFTFQANEEDEEEEDSVEEDEYSSVDGLPNGTLSTGRTNALRSVSSEELAVAVEDEDDSEEDDEDDGEEGEASLRSHKSPIRKAGPKIKFKSSNKAGAKVRSNDKEPVATTESKNANNVKPPSSKRRADFNIEDYLRPGEEFQQRRGPGRPPANGIMSLREMRERKREQAIANGEDPSKGRSQSGRARKDSATEADGDSTPKKAKKRKRSEVNDEARAGSPDEEGEDGEDEKGKGRASTPPPQPKREDFTEEQLKKPEGTTQERLYVILQEATEPMPLPKIYLAIRDKWPWFHFTETSGWESSVRHTLSQHACFKAVGREGKGQLWELDRSVQFERKPRASQTAVARPPPQTMPNGANAPRYGGPLPTYQPPQYQGRYVPPQQPQVNGQRPMAPQTSYHPPYSNGAQAGPSRPPPYTISSPSAGIYPQPTRPPSTNPAIPSNAYGRPPLPQPLPPHATGHRHSPLSYGSGSRPPSAASPSNQSNSAASKAATRPALEDVREGIVPLLLIRFSEQMRQTADPARSELTAQETSKAIKWVMDHKTEREAMPEPREANAEIVRIIWNTLDNDLKRWQKARAEGLHPDRPESSFPNPATALPNSITPTIGAGPSNAKPDSPANGGLTSPTSEAFAQGNGIASSTSGGAPASAATTPLPAPVVAN